MSHSARQPRIADNRQNARLGYDDAASANYLMNGTHAAPGKRRSPIGCLKNQSVFRAFAILKAFYHPEEWVAACELSRRTKIHEATLNRFMQSLVDVGALVRNDSGKYRCVLFVMPGGGTTIGRREP